MIENKKETPRRTLTLWLHMITTAPMSHGRGVEGNVQVFRKDLGFMPHPETGEAAEFEYPVLSGAAMRATLREAAVKHALENLGVAEGSVSKDALRLLVKGGKNDSGGVTVPLAERRKLEEIFPLLRLFGYMDGGGMQATGTLSVSDVKPIAPETIAAGLIQVKARPMSVTVNGDEKVSSTGPELDLLKGARIIPLHAYVAHTRQYFKHDLRQSEVSRFLTAGDKQALEEKTSEISDKKQTALKKGGPMPTTMERREANESMPYAGEVIPAGVSMQSKIILGAASDVDMGVLASALRTWNRDGAFLGGGRAKGHGSVHVQIQGFAILNTPLGESPVVGESEQVPFDVQENEQGLSQTERLYEQHLARVRTEALAYLVKDKG